MKATTISKFSFLVLSLLFTCHTALGKNSYLPDTHYYWMAGTWEGGDCGDLRVEFTNDWDIIIYDDNGITYKGKFYIENGHDYNSFIITYDTKIGECGYSFIVEYNREEDLENIFIEGGDYLEKIYSYIDYKEKNIDWISGKWFTSDKEYCVEFLQSDTINLYQNGQLVNTGSYTFDGKRINSDWKYYNGRIDSFRYDPTHHSIISTKNSEWLAKQNFLETVDLSWLNGTWIDNYYLENPVENKDYYNRVDILDGNCIIFNYKDQKPARETLSIEKKYDDTLKTEYHIINNKYVIDFNENSIYYLYDCDIRMYMKKASR